MINLKMEERREHSLAINIQTQYVEEQSDPGQDRYAFSYTITIENDGSMPAKLLNRHWLITDANGKTQEVRGEGVVGEQPLLAPGESYQYTSGAILETPVGAMEGEYEMVDDQGRHFLAPIPPFSLSMPGLIH